MLQLRDDHKAIILTILNQYLPNAQVFVFGSRAQGKAQRHSDLDLAYKFDKPLTSLQMANLRDAFSLSDLPFFVDIQDYATLSAFFKTIIDKEGVQL